MNQFEGVHEGDKKLGSSDEKLSCKIINDSALESQHLETVLYS